MKHIERYHSRYAPAQLFDLVVDVDQYPSFLPWVITARVTARRDRMMWVAMTMGTSLLHKHFTTKAFLDRPHRVEINSYDPMFECFDQVWTFNPAAEGGHFIFTESGTYFIKVRHFSATGKRIRL